jgi:hypothetical protein
MLEDVSPGRPDQLVDREPIQRIHGRDRICKTPQEAWPFGFNIRRGGPKFKKIFFDA